MSSRPGSRPTSTTAAGRAAERRARLHYRLRGYRVLDSNVWIAGFELDAVLRRGRRLVFVEVKAKGGNRFGSPLEMVDERKQRRLRRAAEAWLASRPHLRDLEVSFEIVAVGPLGVERIAHTF